jgi:hypothetical protein
MLERFQKAGEKVTNTTLNYDVAECLLNNRDGHNEDMERCYYQSRRSKESSYIEDNVASRDQCHCQPALGLLLGPRCRYPSSVYAFGVSSSSYLKHLAALSPSDPSVVHMPWLLADTMVSCPQFLQVIPTLHVSQHWREIRSAYLQPLH